MSRYAEMNSLTILQLSHYTELILPQCNLDVNDCLLIGPSLVCNCCVFFFLFFYLVCKCLCIVSCIGLFMHVCCLNFNKVSVSVYVVDEIGTEIETETLTLPCHLFP